MSAKHYEQIIFTDVDVATHGKQILKNLNCSIRRGKVIAVIGASGSGKTTLLKLIFELLFAEKGWEISGKITRFPGLKAAYIDHNPGLQIFKNYVYEEFSTLTKEKMAQLLKAEGYAYLLEKKCLELSQGEKTIIAVLRNLSLNITLLVLDEVLVNLSAKKREWLGKVIKEFKVSGGTVIIADHSSEACQYADEIILLENSGAASVSKQEAEKFFLRTIPKEYPRSVAGKLFVGNRLVIDAVVSENIASSLHTPLSFSATCGDIIGVSGDNGSGKTTLLEIIAGIKQPKSGNVVWNDKKMCGLRARKKIVSFYTTYNTQQFLTHTVAEELKISCSDENKNIAETIVKIFALQNIFAESIASLSFGTKQRLAIAISMLENSSILIFDEPTYGMDATAFTAFINGVRLLQQLGKIIIIASHDRELLEVLKCTSIKYL